MSRGEVLVEERGGGGRGARGGKGQEVLVERRRGEGKRLE